MERDRENLPTSRTTVSDDVSPVLWDLLDEWEAPRPDAGFDDRVMARIREAHDAEQQAASPIAFWQRFMAWLGSDNRWGLATAMAVILVAAALIWPPAGLQPDVPDRPLAEFSLQQAEDALEDLRMLEELYAGYSLEEAQNDRL